MRTFDTYGIRGGDLERARELVEQALAIKFVGHESMFWGGDYYLATLRRPANIAIRNNYNSFAEALTEESHPEMTIIITVNSAPDPDGIRRRLGSIPEIEFLRRDTV